VYRNTADAEDQLETIAQIKGYKILESRVMPDHVHLFIEANLKNVMPGNCIYFSIFFGKLILF
jgi:REP element-mobilizing transposase RayT